MCKIIIVAVGLIGALSALAAAGPADDRDVCSRDAVEYLRAFKLDPSLQALVDEMKHFYPQLEQLVNEAPSEEFVEALRKLGPRAGCDQLTEHVSQLDTLVPCFSERFDADGLVGLVKSDASVKQAVEHYYACLASISFTQDVWSI